MVLCLVSVIISLCIWFEGDFYFFILYTDRCGTERPGFESRWWREILPFSIPLHIGPGAHHPPLQSVPDMALATYPHLEYSHTSAIYHLLDVLSGENDCRYL